MKEIFECGSCGVITEASEDVCNPRAINGREDYCGSAGETSEMCGVMLKTLSYECGSCGRPTEEPELVCSPIKVR
jgi:hypothetical protein